METTEKTYFIMILVLRKVKEIIQGFKFRLYCSHYFIFIAS